MADSFKVLFRLTLVFVLQALFVSSAIAQGLLEDSSCDQGIWVALLADRDVGDVACVKAPEDIDPAYFYILIPVPPNGFVWIPIGASDVFDQSCCPSGFGFLPQEISDALQFYQMQNLLLNMDPN